MLLSLTLLCCIFASIAICNVEKVIFTAPDRVTLPSDSSIDNLLLISLNPGRSSVRTRLNATFPTEDTPKGSASWLLLEGLKPGQRYEVRVCWLATQPTAFWMYTESLSATFETHSLVSSLSSYAYEQHASLSKRQTELLRLRRPHYTNKPLKSSMLFLQIHAAADYFTLNQALMENVPPVLVDIILDAYLLNIFPQSLVPTAIYITIVAIVAWFLSTWIIKQLLQISYIQPDAAKPSIEDPKEKKQQ